ncbi:transporter substrate-binding domain-containing protein [Nonomuraea sp. NPDC050556]|uniref:transporter substrate-binding domain-containing protein n=1 Tax=Nonomuraea sp. NPDC050556 TaxID=3364369 RepID=UPI0037AAF7E6
MKILTHASAAGALILALVACAAEPATNPSADGKLTMCTNAPYDPFEFDDNGKIVGFDVDLVGLVAKETGQQLEVVNTDFDAIQNGSALRNGTCEIAAAGLTITDQRKRDLDFSAPYFDATQAVMTRKGSKIHSLDDVKQGKVGVQTGTTGLDFVKSKGLESVKYDDSLQQLIALQTGQVDALVQDRPVIAVWLTKLKLGGELKVADSLETGEQYGIAVRKGDAKLLTSVDKALSTAKANGSYAQLYTRWFGVKPAA